MGRAGPVFYGWVVVAAAVSLFLSFGALYAFGSFFRPLSEAFGANRAGLSGLFGVTLALANLLGMATGALADRTGARLLVLLGGLLAGGGLLLAGRADTLWHLYVTYALGLGLGIGFVMVPATETVQHWFVRRRGYAYDLYESYTLPILVECGDHDRSGGLPAVPAGATAGGACAGITARDRGGVRVGCGRPD